MEYPLIVQLDIGQDDFIQVEILEQRLDMQLARKSYLKAFAAESAVLGAAAVFILFFQNVILPDRAWFCLFFWALFAFHFVYNYFFGCKREFSLAVNHLLTNRDGHTFFTPEKGMAYFFENRCEYLTDEQRRFFDYDRIRHIKKTRHLFIFVMKRSREKNMRGFAYMVIPKRNLSDEQHKFLDSICDEIIRKYSLAPWTDSSIMD